MFTLVFPTYAQGISIVVWILLDKRVFRGIQHPFELIEEGIANSEHLAGGEECFAGSAFALTEKFVTFVKVSGIELNSE